MRLDEPFHEGERLAQERAGEVEAARHNGRAISDTIVRGALRFIAAQPMAVLASLDRDGRPWASVVVSQPGFMTATDTRLELDVDREDPVLAALEPGARLGVLVIELATRRRLRVNGRLAEHAGARLRLDVEESFPNCPQYIQRRSLFVGPPAPPAPPSSGEALDEPARELVARADTFFVATRHPTRGLDASHRGGNPGFVRVSGQTLEIPDYAGNSMFQTLGNLLVDPRAGLAFLDFEGGRVLRLTGRASVHFGAEQRSWSFTVESWREDSLARELSWTWLEAWPGNPPAA